MMYDSLHGKLLKLPDATRVYPAHGAGSLCGRSIGSENWSTIGRERDMNAALRPMSREAFIADITRDVPETPVYFLHSRDTNKAGPTVRAEQPMPPMLGPAAFVRAIREGAVALDTRPVDAYAKGHAEGALHVALDGQYASWVGTLVGPDDALALVVEPGREEEAVMRLSRVGYEKIVGILSGPVADLADAGHPVRSTAQVEATDAERPGRRVLDVRRPPEWRAFHMEGATHIPLAQLAARAGELDRGSEWMVVCASGYRSSIAASVLERAGFEKVVNGRGGVDAWKKAGRPVTSEA